MNHDELPAVARGWWARSREWVLRAAGDVTDLAWALEVDGGAHGSPGGPAFGGDPMYLCGSGDAAGDLVVWTALAPPEAVRARLLLVDGGLEMQPVAQHAVDDVRFFLREAAREVVVGAVALSASGREVARTRLPG